MSKITKLDDIEIYREALELAKEVYLLTRNNLLLKEYSLLDQFKRASVSVAANIAEGYGRHTKKDFSQFLSISLGSVNEVIAYLDLIELIFSLKTGELKQKYINLSRRIHSFRKYLQNN